MRLNYDKVEKINKADRVNNITLSKLTADEICDSMKKSYTEDY